MPKTSKSKAKKMTGKKTAAIGKGAKILELLRRKDGATLGDLTKATGWQPHSVRDFLSAHVGKKLGLNLRSTKREDGQRVYQIQSQGSPVSWLFPSRAARSDSLQPSRERAVHGPFSWQRKRRDASGKTSGRA